MSKTTGGLSSKTHIEPLNDTNWETWSFLMGQYLTINNLWDIVSGKEAEPTEETEKSGSLQSRRLLARSSPYMSHHRT